MVIHFTAFFVNFLAKYINIYYAVFSVKFYINNIDDTEVILELSTPSRACIFRPLEKADNEDELMLLMPLMVGI